MNWKSQSATSDALDQLAEVSSGAANRDRNEAETRHKIIDFILHQLLAWPRNSVVVEEHIHPGFADYILKKTNGNDWLFIEAKKEGVYFELPMPNNGKETSTFISIKKVMTDRGLHAGA